MARSIENYVLGELLGRGGTSEVYAATDRAGAPVAIKVLRSHLASDAAAIASFRVEAERTRAVAHDRIVRVLDAGRNDDGFFLVMERLEGETLAARLARGALDEASARELGAAIADGLAAAHDRGIVHRDLKPGNVMLAVRGPVLVDFGIARAFTGDAPASTTSRIGTPAYMAPEQLTGGLIAPCVDVWAFGILLYELVSGRVPFETSDGRAPQLFETAPRAPASPAYAALVARCLAREPGRRPATMREIASLLRAGAIDRITEDASAIAVAPRKLQRWWLAAIPLAGAIAVFGYPRSEPGVPFAVPTLPPIAASQAPPLLAAPAPAPMIVAPKPVHHAHHKPIKPAPTPRAGETLD